MAKHILNIGAPSTVAHDTVGGDYVLTWSGLSGAAIPNAFLSFGTTAFLRYLQLSYDPSRSSRINRAEFRTASTDSGTGAGSSPQMSTAWETNDTALTIIVGGNRYNVLGPNAAAVPSASDDTSEPYSWGFNTPSLEPLTRAIEEADTATRAAIQLELNDGLGEDVILFTTPGTNTWTVPAGVTAIKIELVGGGGGGGGGGSRVSAGGDGSSGESSWLVEDAEVVVAAPGEGGLRGDFGDRGGDDGSSGASGLATSPGVSGSGVSSGSVGITGLTTYGQGGLGGRGTRATPEGGTGGPGGGAAYNVIANYSVRPGQLLNFRVGRRGTGGQRGLSTVPTHTPSGSPGLSGAHGAIRITYIDATELSTDIGSSGGLLPTLEISDTELSADIGSSGGLLPKLFSGRPRRLLPTQTIVVPVAGYTLQFGGLLKEWGLSVKIDSDLANEGVSRWLQEIRLLTNGSITVAFSDTDQRDQTEGDDLSDQFESDGQFILKYGDRTLTLNLEDTADHLEPYSWPGSSGGADFFNAIPSAGAEITIIINAFIFVPPVPDILLNSNIGTEPGFAPDLFVLNPIELGVDIGTESALAPNLRVFIPEIELGVDMGAGSGLAPNLRVVNPIELDSNIGTKSSLTPRIKVFNAFSLSAWDRGDYSAPIVLASLQATVAGVDITVDPVVIAAGELDVVTGLVLTQVERRDSGGSIRLRRSQAAGTVDFNTAFGGNNIYAKAKLIIVLEDDDDRTQIVFNQSNQGGGFSNWLIQDATHRSLINDITTDDKFLLAIALPALELNVSIGNEPGLAPNLRVVNPIELGVDIGSALAIAPNLRVVNPAFELGVDIGAAPSLIPNLRVVNPIELDADIGSETGLAPNLRVVNPEIELDADIGTEPGLLSNLRVINPLSLGAWDRGDYSEPIVLASLKATVATPDITIDPVVIAAGELDVITGLMITQIERYSSGGSIRLRRSQAAGTVNFSAAFGNNALYSEAELIIVLDDDDRTQIVFTRSNQGGGYSNWSIRDATQSSLINDIATGDKFLLAIALPAIALGVSIDTEPGLAPDLFVFNPALLSVDIGTEPGLAPNLRVVNPPSIDIETDIGAESGLAPKLRVTNPLGIDIETVIGAEPGLVPKLQVLQPLLVTMGSGAGVLPNLFHFSPLEHEIIVSLRAEAGLVSRLFDDEILLGPVDRVGSNAGLGATLQVGQSISVAASMGAAARSIQNLVVSIPTIIIGAKPMIAWAMEISGIGDMKVPYRVWSGLDNLDWNGEIWDGTQSANGAFVAVSPVTDKVGTPDRRASVSVAVNAEMTRELLAIDTGPVSVFLRYLYSLDNGLTWIEAPMALAGRLSQPKFEQGLYTVEIETWSGDADRGEPKFWSDETQRAEYPDDKGFEFVRGLAQGIDTRWPP